MRDDLHEVDTDKKEVNLEGDAVEEKSKNTKKGGCRGCLSDGLFYFLVVLNIIAFLSANKKWSAKLKLG